MHLCSEVRPFLDLRDAHSPIRCRVRRRSEDCDGNGLAADYNPFISRRPEQVGDHAGGVEVASLPC